MNRQNGLRIHSHPCHLKQNKKNFIRGKHFYCRRWSTSRLSDWWGRSFRPYLGNFLPYSLADFRLCNAILHFDLFARWHCQHFQEKMASLHLQQKINNIRMRIFAKHFKCDLSYWNEKKFLLWISENRVFIFSVT